MNTHSSQQSGQRDQASRTDAPAWSSNYTAPMANMKTSAPCNPQTCYNAFVGANASSATCDNNIERTVPTMACPPPATIPLQHGLVRIITKDHVCQRFILSIKINYSQLPKAESFEAASSAKGKLHAISTATKACGQQVMSSSGPRVKPHDVNSPGQVDGHDTEGNSCVVDHRDYNQKAVSTKLRQSPPRAQGRPEQMEDTTLGLAQRLKTFDVGNERLRANTRQSQGDPALDLGANEPGRSYIPVTFLCQCNLDVIVFTKFSLPLRG